MRPPAANLQKGKLYSTFFHPAILLVAAFLFVIPGTRIIAQTPNVTVRFSNPTYDCITHLYKVDVDFQCDQASKRLQYMNVRFHFPCEYFDTAYMGAFVTGYAIGNPDPPIVTPCNTENGTNFFTIPEGTIYYNGGVKRLIGGPYIATSPSWTRIFSVFFTVNDPNGFNLPNFFPSLIWDLKEDLSGGFIPGNSGISIALYNIPETIEHVQQFNWEYDTIPGEPYGFPNETYGVSTICGYAPKTILPTVEDPNPGTIDIPVKVVDFEDIGAFNLAFDYDSTVMTYQGSTANSIFNDTNGYLTVTSELGSGGNRKINMAYSGLGITLADSAILANLSFNLNSGSTPLTWLTDDQECFYQNSDYYPLFDEPDSVYYIDGVIESASVTAPITKIDSTVAIQGDLVTFGVNVWNYNNIVSGSLTLDFNSDVLSFYQAIPNDAIAEGFSSQIISTGRLQMTWSGSDTSLEDGTALVYVVFSNLGGISPLEWYNVGSTCQYISSITNGPLNDEPTCDFYINGNVAPVEFVWTGETSSDWNNTGNWDVGIVPDEFTDVTIDAPPGRTVYPTFSGDFTVGVQCKRLTLLDGAQMNILGDFTIDPGHTMQMDGTSSLHIGGNWTNSGTFIAGSGIVDFNGTDDAALAEGVNPENYIEAYVRNTFGPGMTQITGGLPGPTGNNAHSDVGIGFNFKYLGTYYTQVRINTNGWLSLNLSGTDASSGDNSILFDTRTPTTVLAPWWDDLLADGTTVISYKTTGTAPSRVFTVEWRHVLAYSSGANARLNFQVKLYETSNNIEFCYGNVENGSHNTAEGASIGIKNTIGGMGNFLEGSHNSNNLIFICLKSNADWPQVNYRFTPPVPNAMDTFYYFMVSKTVGKLSIQSDVNVIGIQ